LIRTSKEGAVRLVRETGRPIAQVARDLGINEGTLGNWVSTGKRRRGEADGALGEDERAEVVFREPCHRLPEPGADLLNTAGEAIFIPRWSCRNATTCPPACKDGTYPLR
jgi:transposase-like protein